MVALHVNKKMLANHVFWRLMLFNTHLLLLLQPSVLWLSIVSFNNDAKPPPKWILREFDVSRIGPRLGGLPHLERLHGKIWPRLRGLPGLADRATRLGGSPHLSCKRDQFKMRDYMDRRVTSPTRSVFWAVIFCPLVTLFIIRTLRPKGEKTSKTSIYIQIFIAYNQMSLRNLY